MGWWRNFLDTRLRRMLRDSSWMLGSTAISAVLGVIQVVLVTRLLGPDRYGELALIMAISTTVRQLVGVRTWEWAMKEFAAAHSRRDKSYAADVVRRGYVAGIVVNAIALVIVAATAGFSADRFVHDRDAATLVIGYSCVLLVNWTYDTSFAVLRVSGRFRFLAIQQVVMSVLRIVITGGSVIIWRRLDTTVIAYILVELAASVWLGVASSTIFRSEFGAPWWRIERKVHPQRGRMARLMAISWLIDTLKFAGGRVDLLVLGWYRSPFVVANYQAAWNFLDIAQRVTQPITMVAFADLAKLAAAGEGKEMLRTVGKLSVLALIIGVPGCTLLALIAGPLCRLFYGAAYPDSAAILQLLSFSLLWLVGLWMHPSFVSIGKSHWSLEVVIVMSSIKVALLVVLTPAHGASGVALANLVYCVTMPLLIPIYLVRMKRWFASAEYATFTSQQRETASG
jgi:O-antigen/teichoic acid export membrane protein